MSGTGFPPPRACDCHAHVIGPKSRFPLAPHRAYTPVDAPMEALTSMLGRLGLERIVLIQTSIFGTDNSCMLDAVARLGDRARAVAVVPDDAEGSMLDSLHRQGVRGLRVNLATLGMNDPGPARAKLRAAAALCARNGWHVQLFTRPGTIEALESDLARLPVPVSLDHFGLLSPAGETASAEAAVLRLLGSGNIWVKISGSYRLTPADDDAATAGLATRLRAANRERIVWGSDWPHTPTHSGTATTSDGETHYRDLDTAALLDTVRRWFDATAQHEILVANPARLYGFGTI
ncbi:amidohydrolase family protein [Propylenella binzhouense]|nr:amidohydrolase family protein [Propylenella binzhouense]